MLLNLKCHYDQILNTHFFYIFVHNRAFLDVLPNFNLYYYEHNLEIMFLGSLFPIIYGHH